MDLAVATTGTTQTMTSLEIAELTGKRHDHVLRDIRNMLESLEIQSTQFWGDYTDARGRTQQCFKLNRYYTEVLVTGYDVKRRAAVIKRWHDLETGVAAPSFDIPKNYQEALRLAADLAEEKDQLQITMKRNQPKVDFANQVSDTTGSVTVGEFAKLIGTGQNILFSWLRDNKFLFSNASSRNLPYQKHLDAGRFSVIERPITIRHSDGTEESVMKTKTLITGKGQTYIYKQWRAQQQGNLQLV